MNFLFLNSARRGWGGNEKWTRLAAESLAEEHGVFLAYRDPRLAERFTVRSFRLPFKAEVDLVTLFMLTRIIRREKIDVLIPTKRKDYVLAGLASRICGISNILRLGIDRPLKNTFLHKLVYSIWSDGIIVNADKIRLTLLQTAWISPEKIRVIYNGLDRTSLDINANERTWNKPFIFTITSAGALIPRKGFDFLIRSFSRFIQNHPDTGAGLVIMGDGPELSRLKQLAALLGIAERVVFTGFVDNPYPVLKQSDVYVAASTSEGISNALIEAMYFGCVPISTEAGGTKEMIGNGENGFLVQFGNDQQLSSLFGTLYNSPEMRRKIGSTAKTTIRKAFSTEVMTKELLEFCVMQTSAKNNV
ncbi:MAG: glycosyltransferase [Chlorobium limicola]|uniref:Glycosyl transferase group 1 n=1 Tax=Chlorobium limicola (strain DSM 245 / NBRC 103803 / 6330) TaxID=290315 RepID=B3EF94_CHLL2|nr:glycosyltransferase [Chlorobium limicola]ACD89377.1 glycosyl transferase group 1 [Chlorobium limicola DSM 245]NTV20216.1 glycosyltransferase [Chlorobium limicola]